MSKAVFPMWMFFVVAFAIALVAFGLAQIAEGAGVPFVAAATSMWVAYVVYRGQKERARR
jgi:hypothetical protein